MKRFLSVALVLGAVFVLAPWIIGNVAESRVERGLDRLVQIAPALGIVERHYTRGWFHSEQDVTFEILGPSAGSAGPPPNAAIERVQPGVQTAAAPSLRFRVRNEILHGPLLGFSGLGLARVNSRVQMDDQTRRRLVAMFGTDEPVSMSTRVGFFGGNTTRLSSAGRTQRLQDGVELAWDDLVIDVSYSGNLDHLDIEGDWPGYRGPGLRIRGATLEAASDRVQDQLYATDLDLQVAELEFGSDPKSRTRVEQLRYRVDSSQDDEFMKVAARIGTGPVNGSPLHSGDLKVEALQCDFTLQRLQVDALAKMTQAIQDSYGKPTPASKSDEPLLALLSQGPELVLERIRVETTAGAAQVQGTIRIQGATDKDLRMGWLSLLERLDVELRFEAPRALLEKAGQKDEMTAAVEGGYARWQGDQIVSHLEFRAGQLSINGKVLEIPELEPPPPPPSPE